MIKPSELRTVGPKDPIGCTLFSNQCCSYNPVKPSRIRADHHLRCLICILLILSGDVESNPGPNTGTVYLCGLCDRKVGWEDRGVACDCCDIWYHCSCLSIDSAEYAGLDHSSATWECFRCNFSNGSNSLYHSYNLDVSKSFNILSGNKVEDSVFSFKTPPKFKPMMHSSPIGNERPISASRDGQSGRNSSDASSRGSASLSQPAPSFYLPIKRKNLRFITVNCNGISSKKAELEQLVSYTFPDVILLSETKLDGSVHEAEFMPVGYKSCSRKDRVRGGGGVMVLTRDNLSACTVPMEDVTGEVCWAKIETNDNPLYVGSFYRTPSDNTTNQLLELEKSLAHIQNHSKNNPNALIVVAGDFNAGGIDWESGTVPVGATNRAICVKVLEVLDSNNLEQQTKLPTRENSILDLFCTNKPGLVKSVHIIPGISDHEIVLVDCDFRARINKKHSRKFHLWSRADWPTIKQKLTEFQEEFLASCHLKSVEDNYKELKSQIETLMNLHITSKMSSTRYNLPWLNTTLK